MEEVDVVLCTSIPDAPKTRQWRCAGEEQWHSVNLRLSMTNYRLPPENPSWTLINTWYYIQNMRYALAQVPIYNRWHLSYRMSTFWTNSCKSRALPLSKLQIRCFSSLSAPIESEFEPQLSHCFYLKFFDKYQKAVHETSLNMYLYSVYCASTKNSLFIGRASRVSNSLIFNRWQNVFRLYSLNLIFRNHRLVLTFIHTISVIYSAHNAKLKSTVNTEVSKEWELYQVHIVWLLLRHNSSSRLCQVYLFISSIEFLRDK